MNAIFLAGPRPLCESAADANDDGQVGVSDALYLAMYCLQHGTQPAKPFQACGADPTADTLPCTSNLACQ